MRMFIVGCACLVLTGCAVVESGLEYIGLTPADASEMSEQAAEATAAGIDTAMLVYGASPLLLLAGAVFAIFRKKRGG